MSYADKVSLEMDGMKSPMDLESHEETEPQEEKDIEASNGAMAIEAIKKGDGAAFEEAVKAIMSQP